VPAWDFPLPIVYTSGGQRGVCLCVGSCMSVSCVSLVDVISIVFTDTCLSEALLCDMVQLQVKVNGRCNDAMGAGITKLPPLLHTNS